MGVKTNFSIKDLENLSGVKAHTIRIWEKRYNLFTPMRSETNIRTYDLASLQKLLNISFLNQAGIKVSKIAKLSEVEISNRLKEQAITKESLHFVNDFKMSMLQFDQCLFDSTYKRMLAEFSFSEIFQDAFLPLMEEIGILWMTNTITPAHEHFIAALIQQKLQINIEGLMGQHKGSNKVYVLFLPENEIHELGLMYMHYELLKKRYRCVYLGASVPMENLMEMKKVFTEVVFISYFTVAPTSYDIGTYLNKFSKIILTGYDEVLHLSGRNSLGSNLNVMPENIKTYPRVGDLIKAM